MKDNLKVSIALTTYNGQDYIAQQLVSIFQQTRLPDELIVHDDASTDHTLDVLRTTLEKSPFAFRHFANPSNLGYVRNFDATLQEATGDIVFLADQDDVWFPRKVETVLRLFQDNPALLLVVHDLEFCDAELTRLGQTKIQRFSWGSTSLDNYVTGMATAVRGDFLKLCLPIPTESFAHDAWLHACARLLGGRLVLHKVLAMYRRHGRNATGNLSINHAAKLSLIVLKVRYLFRIVSKVDVSVYERQIEQAIVLHDWMVAKKNELIAAGFSSETKLSQTLAELEGKLLNLQNRLAIRRMDWIDRFKPAFKLHFSRDTKWQSALQFIRDIFNRG